MTDSPEVAEIRQLLGRRVMRKNDKILQTLKKAATQLSKELPSDVDGFKLILQTHCPERLGGCRMEWNEYPTPKGKIEIRVSVDPWERTSHLL